jgi:thiol-disulfide isomerase/thioredoxin
LEFSFGSHLCFVIYYCNILYCHNPFVQADCIEFKPEYVKLAKATRSEYPDVQFFAVSCDHHQDACQTVGVEGYPALYVFQAGADQEGELVKQTHGKPYSLALLAQKLYLPLGEDAVPVGVAKTKNNFHLEGDAVPVPVVVAKTNNLRNATATSAGSRMDDGPAVGSKEDKEDDSEGGDSYLYGLNNAPVKEFTGITNVFLKSKKPRVVEFYSPHCVSILNRIEPYAGRLGIFVRLIGILICALECNVLYCYNPFV